MSKLGYADLGFAKVDINRKKRRGIPEAIYCHGKTKEQLSKITSELLKHSRHVILTRISKDAYEFLKKHFPLLKYHPQANIAYLKKNKKHTKRGRVLLITAGTADIPVAEEAAVTLGVLGSPIKKLYDVGVAGVHRVIDNKSLLRKANVIIVIAGMEGALASIVSGLVKAPVIAVPTSFGYGASFKGLSALLTMLNSCSPGVAVVNIDNGFGAGYLAHIINR